LLYFTTYFSICSVRDGKAGRASPLVKNAGWADFFNPLTRISPQLARASSRAGRAGPLTRKKKKMDESSSKVTSNVIEMEECQ